MVGKETVERPSVGLRGVGWARGQASLLEVRSLEESREPGVGWGQNLGALPLPPCCLGPYCPCVPACCRWRAHTATRTQETLVCAGPPPPRRPLGGSKPDGWDAIAPPLTPSVFFCPSGLASLLLICQVIHVFTHVFIHSSLMCWASTMSQALF